MLAGWTFGTITRTACGAVLNSLPLVPYGGVVAKDEQTEAALLGRMIEYAKEADVDIVSVATHPLHDEATVSRYRQHLQTDFVFENFVQLQSLEIHPLAAMKSRSRSAFNRKLRVAAEQLTVRQADSQKDVEQWLDIYANRFEEIAAKTYPASFFHALFERSQVADFGELWLAERMGKQVGGVWMLLGDRCADYFASAFDSQCNELQPGTLVMNEVFSSLIERKIPVLNWQSSPGRGGVYEFKRRWGATERQHCYLSTLLNPHTKILEVDANQLLDEFPLRFVVPFEQLKSH
ncbi:hypothetical protein UC8_06080 [Roseimaritima ulvae]|uniref:BioF2-like acetyltransferase domain-containing protein n=2 Tax=Roseimaritima ulvae TaxID=980254 RepID=A0A5B9QM10_9BACT|nr:hypothetical protein UC8_06080 [Roseimaritima ulvae]